MNFLRFLLHALSHAALESLKLLPFLFLTYLLMEFLEHKAGDRLNRLVERAGKGGPLAGGLLGALPQCGFSAMAAELYSGRVITLGTLFAVFLSTSDEMLPVLIAEGAHPILMVKLLLTKVVIGILAGFLIDLFLRFFLKDKHHSHEIHEICESGHCHCENGILLSAIRHTVPVFLFLFLLSALLNLGIELIGEAALTGFLTGLPALSAVLSALVGCIPNCGASVLITKLLISGVLPAGAAVGGLLTGAGVGTLVLFRTNRPLTENLLIVGGLLLIGASVGFLLDITGLMTFILT